MLLPLLLVIWGFGHHGFDGALGAHLVEVLGDATDRLGHHHVEHAEQLRPAGCHGNQHHQRQDLQQGAGPEGQPQAITRTDPAAIEVGENTKELIEEEEKSNLKRAVAELVEVEHHQHAQGAIGEGEGPVVGGNDAVLLQRRELHGSSATTWQARSAMRQL